MFFGGDPFEHFAQQGGGGGRRPGGRAAANVDTTKLYETLGVSPSATCFFVFVYVDPVHREIANLFQK
jgi:hypothetical protein